MRLEIGRSNNIDKSIELNATQIVNHCLRRMPNLFRCHLHAHILETLHSVLHGAYTVIRYKRGGFANALQCGKCIGCLWYCVLHAPDDAIDVTVYIIEGVQKAATFLRTQL